jgi:hypothetical protein
MTVKKFGFCITGCCMDEGRKRYVGFTDIPSGRTYSGVHHMRICDVYDVVFLAAPG